jgi:hypothetical protein
MTRKAAAVDWSEEESKLLERLKALEPGTILDPEDDDPLLGPWDMLETAVRPISSGEPIYFQNCEGRWVSFAQSEGMGFLYARRPEELDGFREILAKHKAQIDAMLRGVAEAQRRLIERD